MKITTAARNTQFARRNFFASIRTPEQEAAEKALTAAKQTLLNLVSWDLEAALAAENAYIASTHDH